MAPNYSSIPKFHIVHQIREWGTISTKARNQLIFGQILILLLYWQCCSQVEVQKCICGLTFFLINYAVILTEIFVVQQFDAYIISV